MATAFANYILGAWPNTYASACPGRGWHGLEDIVLFGTTALSSGFPDTYKETEAESLVDLSLAPP